MPVTCVVGLQWGDEAKGKTDLLTEQTNIVVRYNGGANAGHTNVPTARPTSSHSSPAESSGPKSLRHRQRPRRQSRPPPRRGRQPRPRHPGRRQLVLSDQAHRIFP